MLCLQKAVCEFCQDRIWGLGRQGYKCIQCKLLVHKRCHKLVKITCGTTRQPLVQTLTENIIDVSTICLLDHLK